MITKGNWKADGNKIMTKTGLFEVRLANGIGLNQIKDNVRLYAASKDLLAAMKAMFKECAMIHKYGGEIYNGKQSAAAIKAGREAIAKAEAVV